MDSPVLELVMLTSVINLNKMVLRTLNLDYHVSETNPKVSDCPLLELDFADTWSRVSSSPEMFRYIG